MGRGEVHFPLQDLGDGGNAKEGIPDLMSHAGDHLSDCSESIFAAKFCLELFDLAQIPKHYDYSLPVALHIREIGVAEPEGDNVAVPQDEL